MDVLMAQVHKVPPPPSTRNPRAQVSPAAERLILWCLEKDPAKRPQSMEDALLTLQQSYGDETYLRNADRMQGTHEAGIAAPGRDARKRSVTEELADLFKQGKGAGEPVVEQVELDETEPVLLTQIKKQEAEPSGESAGKSKTLLGVSDPGPRPLARGSKFSKKTPKV
jgi:serine/threonine protein kinase